MAARPFDGGKTWLLCRLTRHITVPGKMDVHDNEKAHSNALPRSSQMQRSLGKTRVLPLTALIRLEALLLSRWLRCLHQRDGGTHLG